MIIELKTILPLFIQSIITILSFLLIIPILIYFEKKIIAIVQRKTGKSKIAWRWMDVFKLLVKEDSAVLYNKGFLFKIAPVLSFALVLSPLAGLPLFHSMAEPQFKELYPQLGIFFTLGSIWLIPFGILLAGWSSGGNYPILGIIRFCLQTITAELPMLFSIIALILVYNTGNIHSMIAFQDETFIYVLPRWGLFLQPLAAIIFISSIFIKTGYGPFNLQRESATLVDGAYTEYSSSKFALMHATEYIHLIILIILFCTLFLGGHNILPGLYPIEYYFPSLSIFLQIFSLFCKCSLIFIFFTWVRCSLPSYRIDQIISIGRRRLMPLAMINLIITVYIIYIGEYL